MESITPRAASGFQMGTRQLIKAVWPLCAAAVTMVWAVSLGTRLDTTTTEPSTLTVLVLLATLVGGTGAVALIRSPRAPAVTPFLRLSAVVAALLVLMPVTEAPGFRTIGLFLLSAPWEYAAAPVLIHTAFAIGWPHRRHYWSGLVSGWYLVHSVLFLAALSGLVAEESGLVRIIDSTIFHQILHPAGILTAIATLLVALGSPTRRGAHRRPVRWMFAGVALGFGPTLAAVVTDQLMVPIDGVMTPAGLAMVLSVFLGLAGMLALPLSNDVERELKAHSLARQLLDEPDLKAGITVMAATLRASFAVDGVSIRLMSPHLVVTDGEVRTSEDDSIAPEAESVDDRRSLVAPIGRIGDPLGEVRLDARYTGAFAKREREWLAAFLLPIAATLRARRRETLHEARVAGLIKEILGSASELRGALQTIPSEEDSESTTVPPPVDASEVLGQLTDGLTAISRRSEDLELASADAQGKVRGANDLVAQGLDGLVALNEDIIRLTSWSDEVGQAIKAIDNVAFRIDLLANNAALEASRAGEAGETFAVIAEEIRRLASTTAGSSSGIQRVATTLSNDIEELAAAFQGVLSGFRAAMRESETGEEITGRLHDLTGQMATQARSFGPIVDEAHAIAVRRSDRDITLTEALDQLMVDRDELEARLIDHRVTLERVQHSLERIGGRSPIH